MNKKILLIDPPWIISSDSNLWKKISSCYPSLGLSYIAAVLENEGHEVKYIDCTAQKLDLKGLIEVIKRYKREGYYPDYVGITATTALIHNAYIVADRFKKEFKDTKIVLGGTHPTILPKEAIKHADYVVIGEGEFTFRELAGGEDLKSIKGLVYRNKGKVIMNDLREQISDLNTLPIPAYHLLPMDKYRPPLGSYENLPAMIIVSSRNCNGRCTYCFHLGKRITFRSAENIIKEVKYLVDNYSIKEIQFYDDNFLLYKKNVLEFCKLLKKNKIKISWTCFSRIDAITRDGNVDMEYLKRLKASGLHLILFGVETADENVMRVINKRLNINDVKPTIDACRKVGISTRCSYMLGNQSDTIETCRKTIDFAITVDSDTAQFNIATPYPGTQFYDWAKRNNYLLKTKSWENFNVSDQVLKLPTISNREIKKLYIEAHKRYYIRLKIMVRRIMKIKTFTQLFQEIKGGFIVLFFGEQD